MNIEMGNENTIQSCKTPTKEEEKMEKTLATLIFIQKVLPCNNRSKE